MAKLEKKEKTEKTEEFKYGIEDLANAMGVKPASARVQLRNNNIKKASKSYGWNSKTDLEEVVKKIQGNTKPEKKSPTGEKKTEAKKPVAAVKKVKKEAA